MPNLDGTGPAGVGPRTGRGLGNCAPNTSANQSQDQVSNQGQGQGGGRGLGRGRGRGAGRGQGLGRGHCGGGRGGNGRRNVYDATGQTARERAIQEQASQEINPQNYEEEVSNMENES